MHHHRMIRDLVAEVRRLREQAEGMDDAYWRLHERLTRRLAAERDSAEAERRRVEDMEYRERQRYDTLRDLERARERDNYYEESRAIERLRRL